MPYILSSGDSSYLFTTLYTSTLHKISSRNIHNILYNVYYILYSIHCIMYNVHVNLLFISLYQFPWYQLENYHRMPCTFLLNRHSPSSLPLYLSPPFISLYLSPSPSLSLSLSLYLSLFTSTCLHLPLRTEEDGFISTLLSLYNRSHNLIQFILPSLFELLASGHRGTSKRGV